jgi:hypothetical protein
MKSETIWSRLNWPQVAALGITLGGAVLFGIFAPIDWATLPWEAFISGAITIAGIVYGATKDRVVARASVPPPELFNPPRRDFEPKGPRRIELPRKDEEGAVDPVALLAVVAFGVAFLVASLAQAGAL